MSFRERLKSLGFDSYADYLDSEHWSDFKRSYRDSGRPQACAVCGKGKIQLHHHNYANIGRESLDDVDPLCRPHHLAVHEWLKANARGFVGLTYRAIAFLRGEKPVKRKRRKKKAKQAKPLPAYRTPEQKALANEVIEMKKWLKDNRMGRKYTSKMNKFCRIPLGQFREMRIETLQGFKKRMGSAIERLKHS